jgi:AcrR family transcriptional regulator
LALGPRLAAEERSRAIIVATLDLFAREGRAGTTTRAIARAAGVSEALVFKHFPTKDDLYRAILEMKIAESERGLRIDARVEAKSDEEFLLYIARSIMQRMEADDTFLRLLIRSALDGHDLAGEFRRVRGEKVYAFVEDRLRRRARRPRSATRSAARGAAGRSSQPSVVDPALAARIFYGMIFNSMMGRRVFQDPVLSQTNLEETARALVRIFLDGIGRVEEGS